MTVNNLVGNSWFGVKLVFTVIYYRISIIIDNQRCIVKHTLSLYRFGLANKPESVKGPRNPNDGRLVSALH